MKKLSLTAAFLVVGLINTSCETRPVLEGDTLLKSSLQIDNSLKQCISVDSHSIKQVENTRLLKINYNTKQSIGYCGCKSALAQYRVFISNQELSAGLIDFRDNDSLSLTLSNTDILLTEAPVTVSFACAQPLQVRLEVTFIHTVNLCTTA